MQKKQPRARSNPSTDKAPLGKRKRPSRLPVLIIRDIQALCWHDTESTGDGPVDQMDNVKVLLALGYLPRCTLHRVEKQDGVEWRVMSLAADKLEEL